MSDQLNLNLPAPETPPPRRRPGIGVLLAALVLLQAGILALLWQGQRRTAAGPAGPALGADACRDLALKLEKQGLAEPAAAAWQDYLARKGADAEKAAEIWYRIGTLWQDAGQYEKALASYYTSESFARLTRLESEIGRRVQECLDALGKFAALRYELRERTTVGGDHGAGEEVVAEIGPRKITRADLDRIIEARIAEQLDRFGRGLPPEERDRRKADLMKQFSDDRLRLQLLGQYLAEEVLSRRAREERLADQPAVRARLLAAERSLLAGELMAREIAAKVAITPGDVRTYYEANKDAFRIPERARVAHIQVADEEKARALLASLGEGQPFEDLARTLSQDTRTASRGGALDGFVTPGQDELPGLGRVEGLATAVLATEAGRVVPQPLRSARGWHVIRVLERLPETVPPFEEVQQEAYQRLSSAKEREVQEALIRELYQAYDVTIHQKVLGGAGAPPDASPEAPAAPPAP